MSTNQKLLDKLCVSLQIKSLSLIQIVKNLSLNFLGKEFLIKIFKHLQNYTLEIDTLSKTIYI